jgi:hypothetical protein
MKMPYDDYANDETYLNLVNQDYMTFDFLLIAYKDRILHELKLLKELGDK